MGAVKTTIGTCILGILLCVQSATACFSQTDSAKLVDLKIRDAVTVIYNYPYKTESELQIIRQAALNAIAQVNPKHINQLSAEAQSGLQYLKVVTAFTEFESKASRTQIIVYSYSRNPAIVRLRDSIKIPPPEGGAVLKIYEKKTDMNPIISELFSPQTSGITFADRYVAIAKEEMPPEQLENVISHELVHAYLASVMGFESMKLPTWFHEGVAQHLSNAKDAYIFHTGFNEVRMSYAPKDYQEYKLVFYYLNQLKGRETLEQFIREAVHGGSYAEPLRKLYGFKSYDDLLIKAKRWQNRSIGEQSLMTLIAILLLIGSIYGMVLYSRKMKSNQALRRIQYERNEQQYIAWNIIVELRHVYELTEFADSMDSRKRMRSALENYAQSLMTESACWLDIGNNAMAQNKLDEAKHTAGDFIEIQEAARMIENRMKGWIV